MTALLPPSSFFDASRVGYHDQVRVPDGRIGTVIGFYKRSEAAVLVSFSSGRPVEFRMTEVEKL